MKRILLLVLVLLPFLARSQNYSWKFFDRYSDASGFTSVQLERKMMRMMSRQAAEQGDKKLAELLDGIQYIRIVALDSGDGAQFLADAEQLAADPRAPWCAWAACIGLATQAISWPTPNSSPPIPTPGSSW